MQSKQQSIVEQVCNVGSGFILAFFLWRFLITPQLHYFATMGYSYENILVNLAITTQFTVVSLIRGYVWRRYFNKFVVRRYKKNG
jgi:hypothetical protein